MKSSQRIRLLLTLFILNISVNATAQEIDVKFHHLSIEKGLSQSSAYCIFQDSRGFIWIGTEDGLNKYDGYTFKIFKNDPENLNSLSYNFVKAILEDQEGAIWIGTYSGGLNKFNRDKEKFIHYVAEPNNSNSLSDNYVNSIYKDQEGILWIGTENGLNKFDPKKEQFSQFKNIPNNPDSLANNKVMSIYEDTSGTLWIGTHGGLNKIVRGADEESPPTFIHYQNDPHNPNSLSSNLVNSVYVDKNGMLWIGTEDGLNKLDIHGKEGSSSIFIRYRNDPKNPKSLSNNAISTIYEDKYGVLWIGTLNGLNKVVRGADEESPPAFIHYQTDPHDPNSLSNEEIFSIYEDRSSVLWIGTRVGLNKLDQEKKQFIHFQVKPNDPRSLSNNYVRSLLSD